VRDVVATPPDPFPAWPSTFPTRPPTGEVIVDAQRLPRFAALLIDAAVGYAVFVVTASALLSHRDTWVVILAFPLLVVVWEAAWLRFTGATVGHLFTSIRVVWPGRRPAFGSLCWRTVKRYAMFWMISGQPTRQAPGVLVMDTVHPISFARVSRLIDGSGVVASRGWSVVTTTTMFCFCLAIPVAGIVTAANLDPAPLCKDIYSGRTLPRAQAERFNRTSFDPDTDYDCNPHELRNPLLGASLVWTAGAILSVISVADAWQHRERRHSPGRRALARERFEPHARTAHGGAAPRR
jgi:hypothetical protein